MPKAQEVFGPFLNFIFNLYTWFVTRKFGHVGKNCSIRPILNMTTPQNISIGNDVSIGIFCWLDTNTSIKKSPKLTIGNRVHIGAYAMIIAANKIEIGNNIVMSERVTILDHYHNYQDVEEPIIDQPIISKGELVIENECFIGINAVIVGNIRIGKHSVVGANSVVTHDVPDYCVVAGAPAKIIKKYDFKKKEWLGVK